LYTLNVDVAPLSRVTVTTFFPPEAELDVVYLIVEIPLPAGPCTAGIAI
jgi:hypothetical protein